MRPAIAAGALLLGSLVATASEARPQRILSLDQCADQFVLALAADQTLALSHRADDSDSWMRSQAAGHRQVRPTLEAAIGFRPDVVVRYWGGDQRLLAALEREGVGIIQIDDATDMPGVRANVVDVAARLGHPDRGRTLALRMDQRLAEARPKADRGSALYLTAGGFTAGRETLIGAILGAAGFRNLAPYTGFGPMSVERLVLQPPTRLVLGFFDQVRSDWRGAGRHPLVRRAAMKRTAARLPASALGCPAWFAADAVAMLSEQNP